MATHGLDQEGTVRVADFRTAIHEAESSHVPDAAGRYVISLLAFLVILAHTVFVWFLFAHHSRSSYPNPARCLGLYSTVVSTILLVVAVAYLCLLNTQWLPGLFRFPNARLAGIAIIANVANTLFVVVLFALIEAQGLRYQGEGRTLNIYTLVVSVCLYFAAGCVVSYRRCATLRPGRIVLV